MEKSRPFVICALLALAAALVYANSLGVDFIFDDYAFIYYNKEIRTFSPLHKFLFSPEAFSEPVSYHVYRPLASFSFAVNYAINGLNPSGYHIGNLLFHILNSFLLFVLLRHLKFENGPSFAGALIFAVHPVHTEAVTWMSGRGNVLFLFFFLLAFIIYIRYDAASKERRVLLLFYSTVAYALAVLAKEMALPLPALLFGYDLYFHRDWDLKKRIGRMWVYAPFVVVALVYLLVRTLVLGRVGQVEYHGGSTYVTFLTMLRAMVIYGRLLFAPIGLSLSRHFQPVYSMFSMTVFPSLCIVLAAIVAGMATFRRRPYFSFGLFWFAVTMLPVSNIIPVNAIVADRFLYGPSIGFCILVAALMARGAEFSGPRKLIVRAALLVTVLCFMVLSIARNRDWDNAVLLWSKAAKVSPTSFVAYNNLGLEYMKRRQIPEAIGAFNETIKIKDDLPEAHMNLAICYKGVGEIGLARRHYKTAMDLDTDKRLSREVVEQFEKELFPGMTERR